MTRDKVQEIFRKHVLDAYDKATIETLGAIGTIPLGSQPGARDAHLTAIFKAIDEQIERISIDHNVIFHDDWIQFPREHPSMYF